MNTSTINRRSVPRRLRTPHLVVALIGAITLAAACTPPPGGSPPDAVAAVTATPQVRAVALAFVAPASTSTAVTSYEVSINVGSAQPLAENRVVAGLDENATYSFRVRACSAVGCGLWSPKSNSVHPLPPISAPEAATSVAGQPGDRSATVTYTAGADGGSPVTAVEVSVDDGAASPLGTDGVVSGLINGVTYAFRVRTCNIVGCAEWSGPSAPVVPRGVPGQPSVSAGVAGTTISWSWNVPAGNGSDVSGFEVRLDGNLVQTGLGTSFARAFGYAETHTLTVSAQNAAGAGGAGSASARTVDPPAPARSVTAAKGPHVSTTGCTSSACAYIDVTISNFPANTVVNVQCWGSFGGASAFYSYNVTTNGSGGAFSRTCWYGYPGTQAWAVVSGTESNHVGW